MGMLDSWLYVLPRGRRMRLVRKAGLSESYVDTPWTNLPETVRVMLYSAARRDLDRAEGVEVLLAHLPGIKKEEGA